MVNTGLKAKHFLKQLRVELIWLVWPEPGEQEVPQAVVLSFFPDQTGLVVFRPTLPIETRWKSAVSRLNILRRIQPLIGRNNKQQHRVRS